MISAPRSQRMSTCRRMVFGERLSWQETAESFHTSWDKVCDAVESVVTWGWEHRTLAWIRALGVDEIQYAKGHKYLPLVYPITRGSPACSGSARNALYLSGFLHRHRRTTRLPN